MAVGPSEAEILVGELETRIDRLRALYEQYFLGFEKLEPLIPRKDVDRRFDAIRRLHFRNTALRFKFNMLQQRYNTFQMYWLRICRQIEDGTYQRHLNKAKKRAQQVEEENTRKSIDDGWSVDVDVTESPEDLFASFEAAQTKPPSKPPVFSIPPAAVTSLGVDDPFAMSMPPPPKVKSDIPALAAALRTPAPLKTEINVTPAAAFKPSIPPRIAPGSMVQGSEKKPVVLRKAEPTAPRTVAPDALNVPKTIIAPPMGSITPAPAAPPIQHTPAAAFQPARPPTVVPGAGATIKAPPLVFTKVAKPVGATAAPPAAKPSPTTGARPAAATAVPSAAKPAPVAAGPSKEVTVTPNAQKTPPKPPPSSPKSAPKPPPAKATIARPPMPSASKGAPLIRPKAPEPPRAEAAAKPENAK